MLHSAPEVLAFSAHPLANDAPKVSTSASAKTRAQQSQKSALREQPSLRVRVFACYWVAVVRRLHEQKSMQAIQK